MGFKCGIVGLPNVGKSTLFNALTENDIPAENYPFCTIDPNVGVVPVPDPRLWKIAEMVKPERVVPTTMEFVDIAGLVSGAAQGEGLGNQFLSHIRETDAVAQVVRCFEDNDIHHVSGRIDPVADIETIHTELALADLDTLARALTRYERGAKSGDKDAVRRREVAQYVHDQVAEGIAARTLELASDDWERLRELNLITAKPTVYIANVDEDGFEGNGLLDAVTAHAEQEGAGVVAVCAAVEAELAVLDEADRAEMLAGYGLEEPGLNRVIRAGYDLLGLQTFFTAGPSEVRAWTVPKGATAPEAAGRIHTDMQRGFIRSEVTAYQDFVAYGGEAGAKDAGRLRLEGKEYRVRDGDIMHIRFNV